MSQDYSNLYDAEYYRTACGPIPYERNKEWLSFFREIARNIVQTLNPRKVLDAGCAMGFLVESLWDFGVEAWGIDISSYAIARVRRDMQPYCHVASLTEALEGAYDLVTCIEVLEHIPPDETEAVIANLAKISGAILFSSTPFDLSEPTHHNVRPLFSWLKLFGNHGFRPDLLYDASFVTQHAMLLRRGEPAWPDEVLALFSRTLYQKSDLAEKGKRNAQLAAERDAACQQLSEISGRLEDLSRERAELMERAESLDRERVAGREELLHQALRAGEAHDENLRLQASLSQTAREARDLAAQLEQRTSECAELQALVQQVSEDLARTREQERALGARSAVFEEQTEELRASLEAAGREKESLAASARQLSAEREDLEKRLAHAGEELAGARKEGKALAGVVRDLRDLYEATSRQLLAVSGSPGWRAIESYRAWRQKTVASRHWLSAPYEKIAGLVLRWAGSPTGAPPAPIPIAAGQPAESIGGAEPAAQIARFALILSGCPGDTRRYRCEHQAEELRLLGLTVDTADCDGVDYERVLEQYEIFLLHRVPHTPGLEMFIRKARDLGKPVIFDTDDLVFNEALLGDIKALRGYSREEYELYASGVRRQHQTLALCSGALVTTEALRDAVRELFPEMPVWVNRNAVSDAMVRQAEAALHSAAKPEDGWVRIAYCSGTRTHQQDFAECEPALARLLAKHGNTHFMAVGHLDLPKELRAFGERIEPIPPVPWQELPGLLRRADINLAPLERNNRFTEAKSELKYFEAALLGVPTVASDVPAYRLAITHGQNGLLCRGEADWYQALEQLAREPGLRSEMGRRAREDALRRYTTRGRAPELVRVLAEVFQECGPRAGRRLSLAFVVRGPCPRDIATLADALAGRGHEVHLYLEAGMPGANGAVRIHVGHDAIAPSDIAIATHWPAAYTVDRLANTRCKVYLAQDDEPEGYEKSDPNYEWAGRALALPLKKIALGKELAELLCRRDGLPVPHVPLPLDRSVFANRNTRPEGPVRVLVCAQPGPRQRGFAAIVEGMRRVARQDPEAAIAFYGASAGEPGFACEDLGELAPEDMAREMNRSHIHLSTGAALAAMACGCAVVEVGTADDTAEGRARVAADPEAIADAVIRLARDAERRTRLARDGERWAAAVSGSPEETGAELERLLAESVFLAPSAGGKEAAKQATRG